MKLLELRTLLLKIYQKGRFIINPLVKFFLSMYAFNWVNDTIGYDARFTSKTVVLLLSVICAVLPGGVLVLLCLALTLLHVFKVSQILAGLLLVVYAILYFMLMRFSPKQAIAAIAIPVLGKYNLHYCVPIVLGCVSTPLSITSCICGVFIYNTIDIIKAAATRHVEKDLDDILQLFTDIADAVMANKQMYITMIVFALVILAVFLIRKMSFDYAFIVSIGAGVLVNILGFLVSDLRFNVTVNVSRLILMSLVAGVVAYFIELMKRILDYSAIEHVQFEDDDYYYYVKAVPKVNVSIPRHDVKRMSDYEEEEEEETSSTDSDIRYEEFDEDDFAEDNSDEGSNVNYADDFSEYGIRRIDADDFEGASEGEPGSGFETASEGEDYETEMTLEEDDI